MVICTACNKSENTMKETTKEIVMQESTAADLAVIPESSFQEPETTMEEVIQSREKQLSDALKAHITVGNPNFKLTRYPKGCSGKAGFKGWFRSSTICKINM